MAYALHQTTRVEILELRSILANRLNVLDHSLNACAQSLQLLNNGLHSLGVLLLLVSRDLLHKGALRNAIDSRHDLQLRRTLVDIHNTRITIQTLASVILHKARTTVNLDRVVSE